MKYIYDRIWACSSLQSKFRANAATKLQGSRTLGVQVVGDVVGRVGRQAGGRAHRHGVGGAGVADQTACDVAGHWRWKLHVRSGACEPVGLRTAGETALSAWWRDSDHSRWYLTRPHHIIIPVRQRLLSACSTFRYCHPMHRRPDADQCLLHMQQRLQLTCRVRLRLPFDVALLVSSHSGKGPFSSFWPSDSTPPSLTAARRPSCLGTEPAQQQIVQY